MSEAEKAMDILSEVTQKIISETKKREQQNKDIQNNTPEMKWDFEHASIVKMKDRDEFLITKDNEVVSDFNPNGIAGDEENSRKQFIKSLNKGETLELNGIKIKENEIDDDIEQKIKDHYKPIEEVEQEEIYSNDNIEINNALNEHQQELDNFIDNEVINEKENTTNLTKEEVEGMLSDHFKRVEELLDQHNENDIDADTFKGKLNDLTKHIKTTAKQKFQSVKHATTKPVKDLKTYAKNRINKFMNQFNEKLKNASHNIDKKFNNEHEVTSKSEHSKQKIEQTLKKNPSLFKEVALMSQLHEIDKHLDKSNQKLDQLNQLEFNDPAEQQKLEETKGKLNSHVNTMHNEKEKLEQHVNKEQTLESFNEQVNDNKQEKSKTKENTAEMTR